MLSNVRAICGAVRGKSNRQIARIEKSTMPRQPKAGYLAAVITKVRVKVLIEDRNRQVAAMARGLAWAIGAQNAVAGTTNDQLETNGFLEFPFSSHSSAKQFRTDVETYLGRYGAKVE